MESYDEGPTRANVGSEQDNFAGQAAMDPLGFGNKTREGNMNIAAQARALNREQDVWNYLNQIIPNLPQWGAKAYESVMNPVNEVYPGAMQQISDYSLPPEALAALDNILNTRLADVNQAADTAIGSRVADLAKRGVTSSSTFEGSMGEVGKAMQPAINSAMANYWNARLTQPAQNAAQKYSLATDYGKLSGNVLLTNLNTQLNPLLDLYKGANANPFQSNQAADRSSKSASAIGSILSAFG